MSIAFARAGDFEPALRWHHSPAGGIESDLALLTKGEVHRDHLEMGGRAVNAIIQWAVGGDGITSLKRWVRWPMVREAKDDTHAAFCYTFDSSADPALLVDDKPYALSRAQRFWINGFFSWEETAGELTVRRTIFPSTSLPCLLERWEIYNTGSQAHSVRIPCAPVDIPQPRNLFKWTAHIVRTEWIGGGLRVLAPGERMTVGMVFSCREENEPPLYPDLDAELAARLAYRDSLFAKLELITPDPVLNRLFAFSKLHAAETVLATRGGLLHGPGGFNRYLAAVWCNDQNEYLGPFFPFLGDAAGNESAANAYRWFAKYQNDAFNPLPSSVVAEGRGVWNGAGDRGDAAMTACGATRWALANGDAQQARLFWPFIQWCLEYCERQKDEHGVIKSDSDELEERFSSGQTNLATSCLTYDALISAAHLAKALGEPPGVSEKYLNRAEELSRAIETFFGARIQGYETYRYHENLDRLRAWICIPLAVGINDRADGTVAALFSRELWTGEGLLTEADTSTRWDRATLYALRGVFASGYSDEGLLRLTAYASRRLLGDHVPYCIEAYPEFNESQISAESGLFCRIFTEGVCGIRPVGFDAFECTPKLPKAWPEASLRNIHAFARQWNLRLIRQAGGIEVVVTLANGGEVYRATKAEGTTHTIKLSVPSSASVPA
ncbi:MAG: hypothetical protein PHD76_10620 [Methylacidiphilales bacterium]|nr:hypothetical protein [Candidatus Methylacidiphilales bacterium]